MKLKDLSGMRVGRLTVLRRSPSPSKRVRWQCSCECGKEKFILSSELVSGGTKSCGCLASDVTANRNRKHGHNTKSIGPSPTYRLWQSIIRRCYNQRACNYHKYGAKGIGVCDAWRTSFAKFLEDMGEKPDGMTLDRIDNYGGYQRGNCRWATPSQQCANRRRPVTNSSGVKNVYWHASTSSWRVRVSMNGVRYSFGLYKHVAEASAVAKQARDKVHEAFANHG